MMERILMALGELGEDTAKILKVAAKVLVFAVVALAMSLFIALTSDSGEVPPLVRKVAANKEFFVRFYGYGTYRLHDVEVIDDKLIGLSMLDGAGIMHLVVFDRATRKSVYEDVSILARETREELLRKSITTADAVKLAKLAATEAQTVPKETVSGIPASFGRKVIKSEPEKAQKSVKTPDGEAQRIVEALGGKAEKFDKKKALAKLRQLIKEGDERGEKYDTAAYMEKIRGIVNGEREGKPQEVSQDAKKAGM